MKKTLSILCSLIAFNATAEISEDFEKRMLKDFTGQAKIYQKNDSINKKYNNNGTFLLSSYKQNYLLPFSFIGGQADTYWEEEGKMENMESTFQVSMKYPLYLEVTDYGGDLYVTYTNRSHWQTFTEDGAFREIAHEPEVLIDFGKNWEFGGIKNTNILFGYNHQTNGRSGEAKRSWNRIFSDFIFAHKDFSLSVRVWIPFSESNNDEDISDYLGFHELNGRYYYNDQTFSVKTNMAIHENHYGVTVGWERPVTKAMSLYVEGFAGYGDTMIDFNKSTRRLSVGVILTNDLF